MSDALEFLQRPGNEFGREFVLATGTDPLGDLAILANPVARSFASAAATTEKAHLLTSQAPLRMLLTRTYALLPILSGEFTCGFVISFMQSSVLEEGKARCLVGRFVLCAETGEYFSASSELRSEGEKINSCGEIVFDHFHSMTSRRRYVAETFPDVTFLQIFNDYKCGNTISLAKRFLSVEVICETRVTACPACGQHAAKKCACKVTVTRPTSSFDYEPAMNFHKLTFSGVYRGSSALYYRQTAAGPGTTPFSRAMNSVSARLLACAGPSTFETHTNLFDSRLANELATEVMQDRLRYVFPLEIPQKSRADLSQSSDVCPWPAIDSRSGDRDDQFSSVASSTTSFKSPSRAPGHGCTH